MAPVLQCPDCGMKHPLNTVPDRGAFPCRGCQRVLKVPEVVAQRAAASAASAPAPTFAAPPIEPTRALPVIVQHNPETVPDSLQMMPHPLLESGRAFGRVPWWMRLLLWFVAVPLSFLVVFVVARGLGVFTSSQLSDLFLANDTSRFWPVARLLPFVALSTALLVHGGVYALARLRGRSRGSSPLL